MKDYHKLLSLFAIILSTYPSLEKCASENKRCYEGLTTTTAVACADYYEDGVRHSVDCNTRSTEWYAYREPGIEGKSVPLTMKPDDPISVGGVGVLKINGMSPDDYFKKEQGK